VIFVVSGEMPLNNYAPDGFSLDLCILSQEIITKTSLMIRRLMLLDPRSCKLVKKI